MLLIELALVLQVEECGPWAAYVDDPAALQAQLKGILPSLQHVLADITHVMRRFSETLTPQHCKIGEHVGKTSFQNQLHGDVSHSSQYHDQASSEPANRHMCVLHGIYPSSEAVLLHGCP